MVVDVSVEFVSSSLFYRFAPFFWVFVDESQKVFIDHRASTSVVTRIADGDRQCPSHASRHEMFIRFSSPPRGGEACAAILAPVHFIGAEFVRKYSQSQA